MKSFWWWSKCLITWWSFTIVSMSCQNHLWHFIRSTNSNKLSFNCIEHNPLYMFTVTRTQNYWQYCDHTHNSTTAGLGRDDRAQSGLMLQYRYSGVQGVCGVVLVMWSPLSWTWDTYQQYLVKPNNNEVIQTEARIWFHTVKNRSTACNSAL